MDVYSFVLEFSKDLVSKFDGLIRAVVIFGSYSKNKQSEKSDIDVLILVDDLYNRWDELVKTWYLTELKKILSNEKYKKIHANTLTLSVFWEMVKVGDPLVISILRSGIPILDTFGMIAALKKMLQEGKIRPTPEAIAVIKQRIPHHINSYQYYILKALESAYWIFVDSAQCLLMSLGKNPLSPEEIPAELEELSKRKILRKEFVKWYKSVFELVHKIAHKEITLISATSIEEWFLRALDFKKEVDKIIKNYSSKNKQ